MIQDLNEEQGSKEKTDIFLKKDLNDSKPGWEKITGFETRFE